MGMKNVVLGIGIFIVFMFLLHNGIRAFYDAPQYEKFCNNSYTPYIDKPYIITTNCSYGRELQEQERACYNQRGQPVYDYYENGCMKGVSFCDFCQRDFDDAMKEYNRNVFVIALIIGIIVLLVGFFILSIEPVGSSLMASGIGAIVYGTIINWENLGNIGRFLLLLLALIILIWIAVRINKRIDDKNKKKFFGFLKS